MGGHAAIADVGDTLVSLLRDRMSDLVGEDEIGLVSPGDLEEKDKLRLTLYLYDVTENEHLSNDPPQGPDPQTKVGAPLVLDLYYLLTAHPSSGGSDPWTTRTMEEHSVLGRAMQVLRDNAIVTGSDLKGTLSGNDRLHVSIDTGSSEHVVNVWNTFQDAPYRPSVSYVVTPVVVESTREAPIQRVVEAERGYSFRAVSGDDADENGTSGGER